MGLLDEAIRDHLELKRRRGADPSEIARAEREALEPVFPPEDDPEATAGGGAALTEAVVTEDGPAVEPAAIDHSGEIATSGQETAEIDMQAVLAENGASAGAAPVPADGTIEDELLEWESPGEEPDGFVDGGDIPGQERMPFE